MPPAPDEPLIPPPWRGVKQLAVLLLIVAIATVAIWIAWQQIAKHRYTAALARLRATGEPIYLTDFRRPNVAAVDNAATYWRKAIAALSPTAYCPSESQLNYSPAPPYPPAWQKIEDAAMKADAAAIRLAELAAIRQAVNWGPPPKSPYMLSLLPIGWGPYRAAAEELGDAAINAHLHGHDREATHRIATLLRLADDLDQIHTGVIGYLVSFALRSVAFERLEIIAGDIKIGEGGVAPAQLEQLVLRLIGSTSNTNVFFNSLLAERAMDVNLAIWMRQQARILGPMFKLDLAHRITYFDTALAIAKAPNFPVVQALFKRTRFGSYHSHSTHGSYKAPYLNENLDLYRIKWRGRAERRMVATIVALHLYEHDHHRWPASLAELVPKYLPAVPADPFSAAGKPIGYVVLTAPHSLVLRAMVYVDPSLAKPTPPPPPPTPCIGWDSSTKGRQWRDVAAWQLPRAQCHIKLPTTTQP